MEEAGCCLLIWWHTHWNWSNGPARNLQMNSGPAPALPATSSQFILAELLTHTGDSTQSHGQRPLRCDHSKYLMRFSLSPSHTHIHTHYIVKPDYMFDIVLCHRQFRILQVSWICVQHLDFLVKATSPLWHESCTLVVHGALEVMDTLQSEP